MLSLVLLVSSFLLLLLPILFHGISNAATYECSSGGHTFDSTNTANKCVPKPGRIQFGTPAVQLHSPDMQCQLNPEWGCRGWGSEFYCCPELCDDAAHTEIQIGVDEKCQQNGGNWVCRSDNTKICKLTSTGEHYCCPGIQQGIPQPGLPPLPGTGAIDCVDTRPDCAAKADLCIVVESYESMYRDCPKTCNVCGGSAGATCQDMGTDCPERSRNNYCDRALYRDLMNWQCPMSCNRCNNRPPPTGSMARTRGKRRR